MITDPDGQGAARFQHWLDTGEDDLPADELEDGRLDDDTDTPGIQLDLFAATEDQR